VTAELVLGAAVAYGVLGLMIYLLARAPRNMPLRAVTVMIACFALSAAFGEASNNAAFGVEPIQYRLLQHLSQLLTGYSLIAFYLFSALDRPEARRRALWQAVPVVLAAGIMITAVVSMPDSIENAAAALLSGKPGGPVSVPSVALLYLTVNVYRAYAWGTALVWTFRYAKGAEPRLRRGLALAAIGLAAMVFCLSVFAVANVVRWAGGVMPHRLLMIAVMTMSPATVVFLVGFAYPAVHMRLTALRIWWQHRRTYRRLSPLWTVLHDAFPEDALNRVPASRLRDTLSLRGVHRRYYRRVIECRDGLVRISPYLGPEDNQPLADRVRTGLRAHANGTTTPARATPVAIPNTDGLDADVRELVALAEALRAGT
jgi:hypothetical protein